MSRGFNQGPAKSLKSVIRGKIRKPLRVVLYGPEGIGKSTFGMGAPDAIFLGTEKGTENLDIVRIPEETIRSFEDVIGWLEGPLLLELEYEFKTLVVDTVDWLEPLIWRYVSEQANVDHIEQINYAAGYKTALNVWRRFLAALEALRDRRGMWIVLLAHAKIVGKDDPRFERKIDRWTLNLHSKDSANASALIRQWADCLLFANFDERARSKNKWDKKGVGSNRRIVYTERSVAFDAKNRYDLPAEMSLSWDEFYRAAWDNGEVTGQELANELTRFRGMASGLADEDEAKKALAWAGSIEKAGKLDRGALAQSVNRILFVLNGQGGQEEEQAESVEGQGQPDKEEAKDPPKEEKHEPKPEQKKQKAKAKAAPRNRQADPEPGPPIPPEPAKKDQGSDPTKKGSGDTSTTGETQSTTEERGPDPTTTSQDSESSETGSVGTTGQEQKSKEETTESTKTSRDAAPASDESKPLTVLEQIESEIEGLPSAASETAKTYVSKAGGDEVKLGKVLAWCKKQAAKAAG